MEDTIPNSSNVSSQILPREPKYVHAVEFWRAYTDIYETVIDIQIAIINFQNWCSKWLISKNVLKARYMLFFNERKKPFPPLIPLNINGVSLTKVYSQRILRTIIDSNLSFSLHCKYYKKMEESI